MPDANTLVSMSRQVLISRRAEDAEELVKALEEKLYKPLIKPALEICIATVSPGLSQAIKAAQTLALPSASAARFLNQLESVTCDHIYVQGRRTALAFEGKQTVQISDGLYAEDLAQCIHGDQPTAWVTILQGDLARPNLQAGNALGIASRRLRSMRTAAHPTSNSILFHCTLRSTTVQVQSNASWSPTLGSAMFHRSPLDGPLPLLYEVVTVSK